MCWDGADRGYNLAHEIDLCRNQSNPSTFSGGAEGRLGDSLRPGAADLFTQKLDGVAWRSKPSSHIVATKDRTVQPALQRFVAKRMGATTTEVASSHVPMLSHAQLVIDVIRNAAKAAQGVTAAA
jgi:pimeloyl-ACP methyl ester carboxylesterase